MDYKILSDEELVTLAKNNNADAMEFLIDRYKRVVASVCRNYFLIGGEVDDLIQEGMIGVFRAITSYNEGTPFKAYCYKCIKNAIFSAIKRFNCKKNKPLNEYISFSGFSNDNDSDKNFIMLDENFDPEQEIINSENLKELKQKIKDSLTDFEYNVLQLYFQGLSYEEIAGKTNKNIKSIDNAIQRIRKKIIKVL